MHRTQILLDDTDYLALKEVARQSGQSMGEVVKGFVSRGLGARRDKPRRKRYRLTDLKGIIHDPGLVAIHHDEILYGGDQ
ncbi:MAG: hypothetical protein NTW87_19505 [Planctomycetota bacterium]|nr:hypothetical protein [Planctomycetota bacterium]